LRSHPHIKAYLALAAVCFFWGTTYLAIRMALESFSPLALVGIRFTLSGGIMLLAARPLGARLPRGRELWLTSLYGLMVLGLGNITLSYAELWVSSGLAAVMIAVSPFWMVGIEALLPGGERLRAVTIAGMLVGCTGTLLLVGHSALELQQRSHVILGFLVLQLGCLAWTSGSLFQRRLDARAHPVVSGAVQQLATGLVFILLALLAGERFAIGSARATGALLYLVVFGSIVGYSSYIYALNHLPVAIVSMYNYITPVVAVILGWMFYRERFDPRDVLAMLIIFAGVAIVKRFEVSPSGRGPSPPALRPPSVPG
jgi:drug/metabolite transporter (DMT)-like permease